MHEWKLYSKSKKRRKKKKKPGFDSKFLKIEKDITKLISVHDSIIIQLSFWHIVHSLFGHGWLHSNQLCKTCQNCFIQVGVVCAAWWHLRELSQQSNNSCIRTLNVYYDKTWTITVLTCAYAEHRLMGPFPFICFLFVWGGGGGAQHFFCPNLSSLPESRI